MKLSHKLPLLRFSKRNPKISIKGKLPLNQDQARRIFKSIAIDKEYLEGLAVQSQNIKKHFRASNTYFVIKEGELVTTSNNKVLKLIENDYEMYALLGDVPVNTGFCLLVILQSGARVLVQVKEDRIRKLINEAIGLHGLTHFFQIRKLDSEYVH
ncbi:MAG: hypothetical protein BWZ03_00131 [bacterium ADurb.BinA186]|nr:MAG: hypothetical protein BWZ03_00131 [bacterium ADurb.BinA186]